MQLNINDDQERIIRNALDAYKDALANDAKVARREDATRRLAEFLDERVTRVDNVLLMMDSEEAW